MTLDDLLLGLAVFVLALALMEVLRMGAGLVDAAAPASARLRERLRNAAAAPFLFRAGARENAGTPAGASGRPR